MHVLLGLEQNSNAINNILESASQTLDDTHYSRTLTSILEQQASELTDSRVFHMKPRKCGNSQFSHQGCFTEWRNKGYGVFDRKAAITPQRLLKKVLFGIRYLSNKYRDQSSPKLIEEDIDGRLVGQNIGQDDLSVSHVQAERRRREKLNEKFLALRSLVPFVTKMDKASILSDAIDYLRQLKRRVEELETFNKRMEAEISTKNPNSPMQFCAEDGVGRHGCNVDNVQYLDGVLSWGLTDTKQPYKIQRAEKRKFSDFQASQIKVHPALDIQVSFIEEDKISIELQCPWRHDILLDIMQTLSILHLDSYFVQSSVVDNTFVAVLQAKVRDSSGGKRASIDDVKEAVEYIAYKS